MGQYPPRRNTHHFEIRTGPEILLLRAKELVIADADAVWKSLRLFKQSKADFADCLIERSAAAAGCDHTATFDRDVAKHCGMRLID